MKMKSWIVLFAVTAAAMACARATTPTPRVEIISVREGNEYRPDQKGSARPGFRFVTLHARHPATSDNDCPFDWDGITLVDAARQRYRPLQASESRSASGETRPFGLGQTRTVHPHEIRALYEIPMGTQLTHAIVSERLAITEQPPS